MRTFLLALAVIGLLATGTVSANGRARLISSQEAGAYQIDVSILPGEAVVGRTHVSILLRGLESQEPLTTATVFLSGSGPPGAAGFGPIPAPNDSFPSFYETDLPFDMPGAWQMSVDVASELGEATALVSMQVYEPGGTINWILLAALAVIMVAAGVYIWGKVPGRSKTGKS